ncbi:MAG TPA: hypothetical protein VKB18_04045 [Gemmatimonadota bacterium]|nr:hypothetical protein [Gemmatimonadota bacterium]
MRSRGSDRKPERWRRVFTWIAVGVVSVAVAAEVVLHGVVDADFVARRLAGRLPPRFALDVGDAGFSFLRGSLDLRGVELWRVGPAGGRGVPRIEVPSLELRGIHRLALLGGGPWQLGTIRADSARATIRLHSLTRRAREGGEAAPPRERPGRLLPRLSAGEVEVRGAVVVLTDDDGAPVDSVTGLRATLGEVGTTSSGPDGGELRVAAGASLHVPSFRHVTADGRRELALDDVTVSTQDSAARVAAVRWGPPGDPDAQAEGITLSARGVTAGRVDFPRLVSDHGIVIGRVTVDTLDVRAAVRRTASPPEGAAPGMPGDWLERVDVPLALDTVRVVHGSAGYSETPAGASRAGSVLFRDASGRLLGLSNAEGAGSAPGPVDVEVSARLEGSAPLRARLTGRLVGDSADLHVSGGVGSMPAPELSPALVPLAGIRVTAGTVDTVSFDFRMEGRRATGRLEVLYGGLDLEKAGEGEGPPGLLRKIGSSILQRRVWKANPSEPGRDPRVGRIDHRRAEDESFWAYLWKSIRSGLMDVVRR